MATTEMQQAGLRHPDHSAARGVSLLLRVLLAASILLPVSVFAGGSWLSRQAAFDNAGMQATQLAEVLEEHAIRVVDTHRVLIDRVNDLIAGLDDEGIRLAEPRLHERIKAAQQSVEYVRSLSVATADGIIVLSSFSLPASHINVADRDFFTAQREHDSGTFIGRIVTARGNGETVFNVSRRRAAPGAGQAFNGVVTASITPAYFERIFGQIAREAPLTLSLGLFREDGAILARYPAGTGRQLSPQSPLRRNIAASPERGSFRAVTETDGRDRLVVYRRVPGYPLYVTVGIDVASILHAWRATMVTHLYFGVPATIALVLLTLFAIRRTERLQAEAARREQAEVALRQAQKMEAIGQLTGGVAHDMNNLLMVISGHAEIIRQHAAGRADRSIAAIERAAARGAALTRQLLAFSRRQTLRPEVLDLSERLGGMHDMLMHSLRGDIELIIRMPPGGLWPVETDSGELELALLNIAVNARDAMPDGGTLTIEAGNVTLEDGSGGGADPTDLAGDFVALTVTDTGAGMSPDVAARAFEPFFTTKEVDKGTGLGLSQVYGFARQSGGGATIRSAPGRGTTVTIFLPRGRRADPAAAAKAAAGGKVVPTTVRPKDARILFVEDNAEVAETGVAILERLGYRALHAASAAAALAVLDDPSSPDFAAVLTDIVMPGGLSGLDLARRIRARRPALPVVLTTGYSNAGQTAVAEGWTIVPKPYNTETLAGVLQAAIGVTGGEHAPPGIPPASGSVSPNTARA